MQYWLARGVDSFYVESAEYLAESVDESVDEPRSQLSVAEVCFELI